MKKKNLIITISVFSILLISLSLILFFIINPTSKSSYASEIILLPGKTNTPVLPTLTPTVSMVSTVSIRPSPLPGTIGIDGFVQVFGTDGTSLNIRLSPGLDGNIVFQALDGELFVIQDGPINSDGYTWWQIKSSVDANRIGWAVDNYLAPIIK